LHAGIVTLAQGVESSMGFWEMRFEHADCVRVPGEVVRAVTSR
jgi:hypothetical protein